jgi:hypothetical protein
MFSKKLAALVATSLIVATSPAVAQSASEPTPVVSTVNAETSELGSNGAGGVWAALIGAALLAAFILVILEDDDDLEQGSISP